MDATASPPSAAARTVRQETRGVERLREVILQSADLLPAQGPITAFVHHNTLHAFEHLSFDEAVVRGGEIFRCHPYLPEERYREMLAQGRIDAVDIEAELIDDLQDRGDELLGFFGTRYQLQMAMLAHSLRTGSTAELRWIVAETEALNRFREETPRQVREAMVAATRHWIMRDLRNGGAGTGANPQARRIVERAFDVFDKTQIEQWDNDLWQSFTLHMLWLVCQDGALRSNAKPAPSLAPLRHRDLLLHASGVDADRLVHEVLIRFCNAFIDQGFADWQMAGREGSLFQAFLDQYGQTHGPLDRWKRALRSELDRLKIAQFDPLESIEESLRLLGVPDDEAKEFITQSLLALRGCAGMIWQLESRRDRAARPIPAGSLVGYLAVRLVLDRVALKHVAIESATYDGPLDEMRQALSDRISQPGSVSSEQRAFTLFQLAQVIGWSPQLLLGLSAAEWTLLVREIVAFSGMQRRRIYHRAFEHRYRNQTLDAIAVHCGRVGRRSNGQVLDDHQRPTFQIACCIDEREESFRRHLEEFAPECETFGVAGFFAVAMYYRGAADAHFTPLCPVIIQPRHYVVESVAYTVEKTEQQRRRQRRAIGTVTHQAHVGSRAFAGGWFAALLGSLASIPLVMRILFPRATAQLRRVFGGIVRTPALTTLQLERTELEPGPDGGCVGYAVMEMAVIVERLLRDMGLTTDFSRLVVICGHGSSSMNNPHEAAHDCGACGGGRGGPNARAFSQMANDLRVRELVRQKGLDIPEDTFFLGAYHNTCDDSVAYYDLERLPNSHRDAFEHANHAIDEARARNAHERCRRFESVNLSASTRDALRHVEGRAEDLSQVRPEYGHATNALCFVGRRSWSRGLFLDRRAFLQSYEPDQDDAESSILERILQAVIPVCAGINLEYFFSYVDPTGYGCGTKLPHNITSLVGVMNGAASDLRPGLPWQMVEIHEPVRLLFVIETTPEAMRRIMDQNQGIAQLVHGAWVQLATLDPQTSEIQLFRDGDFRTYEPTVDELPQVVSSLDWYRGWRDHLGFASIDAEAEWDVLSPANDRAGAALK